MVKIDFVAAIVSGFGNPNRISSRQLRSLTLYVLSWIAVLSFTRKFHNFQSVLRMNSPEMDTGGIRIEKLNQSSFRIWKQKSEIVLMLSGVQSTIVTWNNFHYWLADKNEWTKKDKFALDVVGVSLSLDMS